MSVRPCSPPSGHGTLAAGARVSVPDGIGRLKIKYRGFVGGLFPSGTGTWPFAPSGPSLGPETLRGGCSASRRQFRTLMRFEGARGDPPTVMQVPVGDGAVHDGASGAIGRRDSEEPRDLALTTFHAGFSVARTEESPRTLPGLAGFVIATQHKRSEEQ